MPSEIRPKVDVSIIIVNWNSVDFLRECIASVMAMTQDVIYEIIVIDNASYDGSQEMLRREFPQVLYIQSDKNLGFSKANNLAFELSVGTALLFLNPDTVVLNSAVSNMFVHLSSSPTIGAVGAGVLNTDKTLQMHYVQAFPTIFNQILVSESAKKWLPKSKMWGIRPLLEYAGHPVEVDVVMGSCVMVKRAVFVEAGRFDEDYFMYAEDVALCYAIRKCGYRIDYVRDAAVIHHGGKSSDLKEESQFSIVMPRESMVTYFTKTKGKPYATIYKWAMAVSASGRLLLIALVVPFKRTQIEKRRLAAGAKKWRTVLRWSLGLETLSVKS
jgi:GT2 family glycosyltransferase